MEQMIYERQWEHVISEEALGSGSLEEVKLRGLLNARGKSLTYFKYPSECVVLNNLGYSNYLLTSVPNLCKPLAEDCSSFSPTLNELMQASHGPKVL
ncbi:Hypothetical predicted protein [Pelobates cultripes]|uniref:Uncharacterized protein n=1 Tax=Pelobates cultripes TaxID=61616 RepID=A0AAD1QZI4_PELCU|nr:Hypothetical predicted protein [Pelobates cultripes]